MEQLRLDANDIISESLKAVNPAEAVKNALQNRPEVNGRLLAVAIGKASWQMAQTCCQVCGTKISQGICITKYGHDGGPLENFTVYQAGHPVGDQAGIEATKSAEQMVSNLTSDDQVIMLISGGGSALFEDPLITLTELQDLNRQLLASGADIAEINTIRKCLSKVKGGRFAQLCHPAKVYAIILSDVLGDKLEMIASGPCVSDDVTAAQALAVVQKYQLKLSNQALKLITDKRPLVVDNVTTCLAGSVTQLCQAAYTAATKLGYATKIIDTQVNIQAKTMGEKMAEIAKKYRNSASPLAFIWGGETVVKITGTGMGGRNQEVALAAASGISGLANVLVFSLGSDGTDGPTPAAGGLVDGQTAQRLKQLGVNISDILQDNDSYHALSKVDGLLVTGPTNTNVNDLMMVLIKPLKAE